MSIASAHGVSVSFRRHADALVNVTLEIPEQRIFGLLGPNGAGKSTFLRTLCGLLSPTRGSWMSPSRRDMGVLIEEPGLHPWLTVAAELRYWARVGDYSPESVARALELADLGARARSKVRNLSHGMKQRLGVAATVLGDPKLIILDEPFNGLDPEQADSMVASLREIVTRGTTVILSTHQLSIAESCCDDVAILVGGRVRKVATIADLSREETTTIQLVEPVNVESVERHLQEVGLESMQIDRGAISVGRHLESDLLKRLDASGIPVASISRGNDLETFYRSVVATEDA